MKPGRLKQLINSVLYKPADYRFDPMDKKIIAEYNKVRPSGKKKCLCYVPYTNMSFTADGTVLSCNYNQSVILGKYPAQTIHEMWNSDGAGKLRECIRHNDLNCGCQYCKNFLESGKFSAMKPQVYDRYSGSYTLKSPKVMEFILDNTCNLECVQCSGIFSSLKNRTDHLSASSMPYDDSFLQQLENYIPYLEEAKFYGGEPFLIDIYYKIWEKIIEIKPGILIFTITNGTILNDRIRQILSKGNFDLAVSVDAVTKNKFEEIRKGAHFETVMSNLEFFNDYCLSHHQVLSVSTTLMRNNWEEVPGIVDLCNKSGARTFFSYLTTPVDLAIYNLEYAALKNIYDTLSKYDFPENTAIQKYNKSCYDDFVNQIHKWMVKANSV